MKTATFFAAICLALAAGCAPLERDPTLSAADEAWLSTPHDNRVRHPMARTGSVDSTRR